MNAGDVTSTSPFKAILKLGLVFAKVLKEVILKGLQMCFAVIVLYSLVGLYYDNGYV